MMKREEKHRSVSRDQSEGGRGSEVSRDLNGLFITSKKRNCDALSREDGETREADPEAGRARTTHRGRALTFLRVLGAVLR